MGVNWTQGEKDPEEHGVYKAEFLFPNLGQSRTFFCFFSGAWHRGRLKNGPPDQLKREPVLEGRPVRWAPI